MRLQLSLAAVAFVASIVGCPKTESTETTIDAGDATGTQTSTEAHTIYRSYRAMGTQVTFTAFTAREADALAAFEAAHAEMVRLENVFTVWKEDSDVSRANRAAGIEPVPVSPETFEVLEQGLELSRLSGGKFDLSFGALAGLWKFDHDQDNQVPDEKVVKARLALVDYRKIKLDPVARTVFLEREGMRLHLGGLGKGYAVDRAVALLRERGLSDFMIQAGGDLYVAGTHGQRAWRVGIRDPRGPATSFFAAAEVTDATFSTSGDYERFFIKDGRRYHHIIDPSTGEPSTGVRSVTVMAKSAALADGLSTSLMLVGVERGLEIVESMEGVGAVFVDANNDVKISKRLEGRVKIIKPPKSGL